MIKQSRVPWRFLLPILILLVLLIATVIGFLRLRNVFHQPVSITPPSHQTTPSPTIKAPLARPKPPVLPSHPAHPLQTPPPLSALPTPPIRPEKLPEGDIRLNPEYRKNTLKDLESQRITQAKQFHEKFFQELGLSDEQTTEFAKLLVGNELWFFERSIFPGEDGSFPAPPQFKEVAQKRQEMLESISEKFGREAAEKFRHTYPGPGDSGQDLEIP